MTETLNKSMSFKFLTTIVGKGQLCTSNNLINCSIIGMNVIDFVV